MTATKTGKKQYEIGKESNFARASRFFVHFFDVTARLKGDVTRDDTQRRFLAQHSLAMLENNVATIRNNIATMLQRCFALKIVVANRLV